jgi:hypothetical protein
LAAPRCFGNDVWTNTAGGNWNHESNWSHGVPEAWSTDAVIGLSGVYTVTISQSDETDRANSLAITDRGATLTGSGTLSIATTLDNAGIIDATGCNFLHIETNTLINEYSGVIAALNGGDLTITDQTDSANYGLIKAANGGSLTIENDGTATNYGVIQAVNDGTIVFDNNQSDANRGEMKAADGGSITINVALSEDTDGGNFGKMAAVAGGTFSVVGDMFNAAGAAIKAVGEGSQFTFSNADYEGDDPTLVGNAGTILAADHGGVSFCGVGVGNHDGGAIVATGYGTVAFKFGAVHNAAGGVIAAEDHGTVTFEDVNNDGGLNNLGTVEALGWGSQVSIQHSTVTNGTLTADGGTLFIGGDSILSNVAIVIEDRGIAEFGDALDQGITFNGDGALVLDQAPGEGATVTNFAANGANDVLDFTNIAWADGPTPSWLENEQQTAGSLTITYQTVDGNMTQSHSESLTLNGNYAQNGFTLLSDPWGGTEVVYGVRQAWTGGTSVQWNTVELEQRRRAGHDGHGDHRQRGAPAGHYRRRRTGRQSRHRLGRDPRDRQRRRTHGDECARRRRDNRRQRRRFRSDPGHVRSGARGGWRRDRRRRHLRSGHLLQGSGGQRRRHQRQQPGYGVFRGLRGLQPGRRRDRGCDSQHRHLRQCHDRQSGRRDDRGERRPGAVRSLDDHQRRVTPRRPDRGLCRRHGIVHRQLRRRQRRFHPGDAESVVKLAGSTIDGGEIGGAGTLEVAGSSVLKGSAEVAIGQINVEDGNTLTLDHVSIDGSTINLGHAATGQGPSFTEISVPDVHAIGPSISANGEFVAFIASTTLPGQDHGDVENVAVELYDAATGKLTDISAVAPALPAGDISLGFSNVPSISADGRYVVFDEKYEVPNNQGPPMQTSEVILYDRQSQTATVLETNASHAEISGDGQYIVMQANSIPGHENSFGESALVTDRAGNVLTTISGDPNAPLPQDNSDNFGLPNSVNDPAISSDGRYVTFLTTASEVEINGTLVQTGNNTGTDEQIGNAEVYLYDRLNDTLRMVSVAPDNTPGDATAASLKTQSDDSEWPASMSADGRYIVFSSTASNLAEGVGDVAHDVSNIFLYDTQTGTITAITHADSPSAVGSIRPEISADGTLVTFASDESDLPGANGIAQTYSYDTQTQTTQLVSGLGDQFPANAESDLASAVSANGSAIAFGSLADNLVIPTANDGNANIYLVAPGTVAVTGDTTIDDNATINNGTVIVDNCVTLTLSDVALNGTFVQVGAGANLDLLGAIHNNATLEADGGTIFANSNTTIDGTGNVIITGGGLAHFADVFNQDVTFAGPGTLQLDQSVIYDGDALTSSYTGTISGFGKGDTIDLTALNYSCTETDVWNGATHTLIISNGTQTQLLSLAGSYTQHNFALARDSSGGTEVVLSPTHVTLDGLDETAMPKKTIRSR